MKLTSREQTALLAAARVIARAPSFDVTEDVDANLASAIYKLEVHLGVEAKP